MKREDLVRACCPDVRFNKPKRIAWRSIAFPSQAVVLFTAQEPKTEAIRSVHPRLSYSYFANSAD